MRPNTGFSLLEWFINATSTCPLQALLQEYFLGSTSDATAASMEAHLASCPDCRKR